MAHYAYVTVRQGAVSGRHRGPGLSQPTRVAVVAVVAVVAAAGFAIWRSGGDMVGPSCQSDQSLTIAAAPELAPALDQAAQAWAEGVRDEDGVCVAVDVSAADPADVALAIANAGGVVLSGLTPLRLPGGEVAPSPSADAPEVQIPDVWVPDSTAWLVRVRSAGPGLVPPQAPSVAASPVLLAAPKPVAETLGWPTTMPTWDVLLQQLTAGQSLRVGIVEPNRDAAGLTGLVALGSAAAATGPSANQVTVALMRALFAGRSPANSDLLTRFPASADAQALADGLGAAPMAEHTLISYNASGPEVPLAGLYVEPAPPALDYPFTVMPGITGDRALLAEQLRQALAGDEFRALLGAAGLRAADGTADFDPLPGAPEQITPGELDGAAVSRALATWISVTRPARMLAVMDVSGSMAEQVPTAGGATRAQIAIEAARQGMLLFDDSWSVGLWTFSTDLDGAGKDYRELLPIRPMSEQRPSLIAALQTIQPVPDGATGLYDTVYAAYQAVRAGWDPNAVNSVVLLTDGRNEDRVGLNLDQLVAELQKIVDPRYPVQVIAIGIGDAVSQAELERITNTTGGGTFIARDPSAIGPIFLQALSLRPPAPPG